LAGDWPQWRGPFLNGSTDEKDLPDKWSNTENVAWVKLLPGQSSATPVICKGRVFVSTTVAKSEYLLGLCFDAKTGRRLWQKKLSTANRKFSKNNMACPSPVSDGKNVYFLFGNGKLVAVDFDGKILWTRSLEEQYGTFSLLFGYSASPLLYDGKLYISVLRRDKVENGKVLDSFFMAIDCKNGKNLWKHERKTGAIGEALEAYSTPIAYENGGRMEIGIVGSDNFTGHDPQSGLELWRIGFNPTRQTKWNVVPTLVTGDGIICAAIGRGERIIAIRTDKGGPLTEKDIAWKFEGPAPDASTPLYYKGNLYALDGKKTRILTCLDAKTGRQKWQGKLKGIGPVRASMTASDDKIYLISISSKAVVLAANDEQFKILHEVELNEAPSQSSIAIADGHLFIRTAKILYCIGK
jgi:outer membrane protein assembly factor BamB